MKENEMQIPI